MEDEEKQKKESEEVRLPETPPIPLLPEAPKLRAVKPVSLSGKISKPVSFPPLNDKKITGGRDSSQKAALALSSVGAFTTPILVLTLGGYWLDEKFHHTTMIFTILGLLAGMAVGTVSLISIMNRMMR